MSGNRRPTRSMRQGYPRNAALKQAKGSWYPTLATKSKHVARVGHPCSWWVSVPKARARTTAGPSTSLRVRTGKQSWVGEDRGIPPSRQKQVAKMGHEGSCCDEAKTGLVGQFELHAFAVVRDEGGDAVVLLVEAGGDGGDAGPVECGVAGFSGGFGGSVDFD
jgi:hypothetical protein